MTDDTYNVESGRQTGGVTAGKIEIHTADQAAASATEGLNRIREWLKELRAHDVDVPEDIRELVSTIGEDLNEIRSELIDAGAANVSLQRQIDQMQEVLDRREELYFAHNMMWKRPDRYGIVSGKWSEEALARRLGPFCPRCFQVDGLVLNLARDEYCWRCTSCDFVEQHTAYPDVSFEPPEI